MKAATIFRPFLGLLIISFLVFCPTLPLSQAQAQDTDPPEPDIKYSQQELAQMLAPIALYPDALLSQILMASTYPIEVIEADRWRKQNPALQNEALDTALLDQDWDPSVKAVCHFPSILTLMSERISETTNIGNAFLAQETEVMAMVQELRARARQQGNLNTTAEQKVIVEKETIIIEPANPRVVYVPYYDPYIIYGPWWYPDYRPYYWGPPGVNLGLGISFWPGFYFGFSFGNWAYFDWHHRSIYYHVHNRPRFVRHERWVKKPGRWNHVPHHRRGVAYRDKHTAQRYGQHRYRSREYRPDTRGFPEGSRPDRDRDRRDGDRSGIDRERQGGDRTGLERDRKERQQVKPEKQRRKQPERDRQERQQVEREKQRREQPERERREQQRVEPEKQERGQPDRDRREQQRVEPEKQRREQPERERREQQRVEPEKQRREQPERDRQQRQQVEQERRPPARVDSGKAEQRQRAPEQSRDNIFNRVDNGRGERQSSERGQSSRQGGSTDSRGKSRMSDGGSGGRYDRGGGDDRSRFRR
ncbi:MAG: DUF3300 domain-containing protein [Deltaproteobacteria bacterium]|nr:DUF3300 domain-containing protein [Deltaproteobacteria bacterium]